MKKLHYLLCVLVIMFTPLDAFVIVENVTYGRVVFVLMLLITIFFYPQKMVYPQKSAMKCLISFIVVAFISSSFSKYMSESLFSFLYLIQYYLILVICWNTFKSPKEISHLIYSYILGSIYLSFVLLLDYKAHALSYDYAYRSETFGNPNENSFLIVFAVILTLIVLLNRKVFNISKKKYLFLVFSLVFFSVAVISTASRMGVLLLIITFLLYIVSILITKFTVRKLLFVVFLSFFIIIFTAYFIDHATLLRLSGIGNDLRNEDFSHRQWIWAKAFEMIENTDFNYFLGEGWGTFPYAFNDYTGLFRGAHNFYLTLFFTTGFLGFSIVVFYFFLMYKELRRSFTFKSLYIYSLLLIPIISMISTNWGGRRWWFLLMLFCFKLPLIIKDEK